MIRVQNFLVIVISTVGGVVVIVVTFLLFFILFVNPKGKKKSQVNMAQPSSQIHVQMNGIEIKIDCPSPNFSTDTTESHSSYTPCLRKDLLKYGVQGYD